MGTKLTTSDDTTLTMTGNLPDMIDRLNEMQEKYIRIAAEELKPPRKVQKMNTIDWYREIPVADCI